MYGSSLYLKLTIIILLLLMYSVSHYNVHHEDKLIPQFFFYQNTIDKLSFERSCCKDCDMHFVFNNINFLCHASSTDILNVKVQNL